MSATAVRDRNRLTRTALKRGRLLELLVDASGRGDPQEQLFVTGTFSLLDLIRMCRWKSRLH